MWQDANNCEKLNAAAPTIDLGVLQVRSPPHLPPSPPHLPTSPHISPYLLQFKPGTYKYMSSRNNNFSNRVQKVPVLAPN